VQCISRARILRQFFQKGVFQRVFMRNREYQQICCIDL